MSSNRKGRWIEHLEERYPGHGLEVASRMLYPWRVRCWHRVHCWISGVEGYEETVAEVVKDITQVGDSEELLDSLRWWRHRLVERSWMVPSSGAALEAYARTALVGV